MKVLIEIPHKARPNEPLAGQEPRPEWPPLISDQFCGQKLFMNGGPINIMNLFEYIFRWLNLSWPAWRRFVGPSINGRHLSEAVCWRVDSDLHKINICSHRAEHRIMISRRVERLTNVHCLFPFRSSPFTPPVRCKKWPTEEHATRNPSKPRGGSENNKEREQETANRHQG